MSDYQAIYDAVRSRIHGGNIDDAVFRAVQNAGLDHAAEMVKRSWQEAAWETMRPSVLFKPSVELDGNAWIALYGSNIQEGVVGTGDSPDEAMRAFDAEWGKKYTKEPTQ
jgi:hypothetical protein